MLLDYLSDILLASMDRCRGWVFHRLGSVLPFAVHAGCACSVGLQDAARADPAFLEEVVRRCAGFGAFRASGSC